MKLYTKEELSIPKNVLARVNTRGQIYESGLARIIHDDRMI